MSEPCERRDGRGRFLPGNVLGGGVKGRSGRRPMKFYDRATVASEAGMDRIAAYLDEHHDPTDPAWRWAAETAMRYGYALAAQRVEMTTASNVAPLTLYAQGQDGAVRLVAYAELVAAGEGPSQVATVVQALIGTGKLYACECGCSCTRHRGEDDAKDL